MQKLTKLENLISLGHRELIYTFLGKGYVDAVASHEESVVQYMKDYDTSFRILEDPLMVVGIGVAFAKDDDRGICVAAVSLFYFFHAQKAEAEERLVEIVNYVKVQCSTYTHYNESSESKSLLRAIEVPDR